MVGLRFSVFVCVLLEVLQDVRCHLCMMSPVQRGDMDISKGGSDTCFRHGAPCGGTEPGSTPFESVVGGKQYFVKWQQNFNHYTVGYPGYMDIAIAPVDSDDWQLLAFAPDEYVYAQDNQQNYSSFVVIPNINCPHCVVRARYNSHKPGEDIFYQCADLEIKKSEYGDDEPTYNIVRQKHYHEFTNTLKVASSMSAPDSDLVMRGFAYSPFDDDTLYIVKVNMNGEVTPFGKFSFKVNFGVDSKQRLENVQRKRKGSYKKAKSRRFEDSTVDRMFILDSVATVNENNNLVTLYHPDVSMDIPANWIVEFDSQTGQMVHNTEIKGFLGEPISAIISNNDGTYITFSMQKNGTAGYNFVVGQLYMDNGNFTLHLQGTDTSKFLAQVELQVEQFAFMNMHYYAKTGKFYALSPGMFFMAKYRPYWQLIEINPMNGTVTPLWLNMRYYLWKGTFGGSVFHGLDQKSGMLYHVLPMLETEADVIIGVNVNTKNVTVSQITNIKYVYNLALTRN
ncbi:hypothetical protein FSP39_001542 [Pinctada imbricata]|uniref:Uncharacterized protein n=1 Tax=Pinctada imbricata TaxID=66713 RepID=A0AA88YCC7_PINIB|nr:hypothetical protein FSP39_001542 [Pinctada imbricata]